MMDKEMLTEISDLMEEKLKPVYKRLDKLENDMKYVRVNIIDNNVFPRLDYLERDTRFATAMNMITSVIDNCSGIEKRCSNIRNILSEVRMDICHLDLTVEEHSQELKKLLELKSE